MSLSSQNSLHGTILQLKEIVTVLQGADHEAARLIGQMEALILEIERKTRHQARVPAQVQSSVATPVVKPPTPAQATV
jgi:hypothetical protein